MQEKQCCKPTHLCPQDEIQDGTYLRYLKLKLDMRCKRVVCFCSIDALSILKALTNAS